MRARSTAEFVSKLQGGLQELEETGYWLELLVDSQTIPEKRLADLLMEIDELTAILVTCVNNAKRRQRNQSKK